MRIVRRNAGHRIPPTRRLVSQRRNQQSVAVLGEVSQGDYSASVIKMGPPTAGAFSVSDYFTPFNQAALNSKDMDLGSGGALLLDQPFGSPQHLLFLCGKEGKLYVLDRDNMGKFNSASDQVIQSIPGANPGAWNSPAWWNNTLYLGGASERTDITGK